MAVFVDNMRAAYRGLVMCHMLATTDEELHEMAARIGVDRRHWQSPEKSSGSHYDICLSKKRLAVKFGAVEISMKEAAAMNARRRETGSLGEPHDALQWFKSRMHVAKDQAAAGRNALLSCQLNHPTPDIERPHAPQQSSLPGL